ncbi:MAG: cytochrome P450 [bacterium]|nr:cytochrome P450 [bacterium]
MTAATIEDQFAGLLSGGPADPGPFYARARSEAPIFRSQATGGWVVAKRDDVMRVLTDEDYFAPLSAGAGSSVSHGRTILHMSGEEHRKKLAPIAHRIRRPASLNGEIGDLIRDLTVDLMNGLSTGAAVDLKAALTTPMPLIVTARIMGLPDAPKFRDWYNAIVAAGASNLSGDPEVTARGVAARKSLAEWLTPLIEDRRQSPGDDLLSDLCTLRWQDELLPVDEIVSFCSFILAAGVETTDRALSSLLKRLISEPSDWAALAADRELIPSACAEALRWAPPVHGISRGVITDTTIRGVELAAGDRVLVLLASANRDEDYFDVPDSFVVDRFRDNPKREFTPKASIMPFGAGTHHCTGSLLALQEMTVAMNLLLDRVEHIEFVGAVPEDVGYVLRSPASLPVRVKFRS